MAGRRSPVTEIREILRQLKLGERVRRIARDLEVSRNTVAQLPRWAATHGLLTGPLPEPAARRATRPAPPARATSREWAARGFPCRCWCCLGEKAGDPFLGDQARLVPAPRRPCPDRLYEGAMDAVVPARRGDIRADPAGP